MRRIPLLCAVSLLATPFLANAASEMEREPNNSASMAQDLDGNFDTSFNPLIGENNPVRDNLPVYSSTDDPHAEIAGSSEAPVAYIEGVIPDSTGNSYDWYSFTIDTPGSIGIIDIDCAWDKEEEAECKNSGLMFQFDAFVQLFDTDGTTRLTDTTGGDDDGNAVFGIYDSPQDPGSNSDISIRPEGELRLGSRDSFVVYTFDTPGTYFVRVGSFGGYEADNVTPIQQPPVGDYLLHVSIVVEDDDGDGVVNDFDLCPDTPAGQAVDPSGCAADDVLESVSNSIDALIRTAGDRARTRLERAKKRLDQARRKLANGDVAGGLRKLKYTAWELHKAKRAGADTAGLIAQLVDYSRAKAEAAIAMSTNRRDIYRAKRYMARAERLLRWGFSAWAIEYFARAWEAATDDDDDGSDDDSSSDDGSSDDDSSDDDSSD